MGAWGAGPFDSDAAGDFVAKMMKPIKAVVESQHAGTAQDHYYEARAAAQCVLLAHGTDILGGPPLDTVLRALVRIRGDGEWLGSWKDPKKVAKAVEREIDAVLNRMRTCKGCRRTFAEVGGELRQLAADAKKVEPTKIPSRKLFKRIARRRFSRRKKK